MHHQHSSASHHPAVMVAGYFDGLHAGHIRFLEEASRHGDLIVGIGCDARLRMVKGREPLHAENERRFLVESCKHVSHAFVMPETEGAGGVVWEKYLDEYKPAMFIANDDLSPEWRDAQREACARHGVEYRILPRDPAPGLPPRSSTELSGKADMIPYRVVLSTWPDQMTLSTVSPGLCIGMSIFPTQTFDHHCGMATSTRGVMHKLWGNNLPTNRLAPLEIARLTFGAENTPAFPVAPDGDVFPWGTFAARWITGAIDPITVAVPGISACFYGGKGWPDKVETIDDPETLDWLERVVTLFPTRSRPPRETFDLRPTPEKAKQLADASYAVWDAIRERSTPALAAAVNACVAAIDSMSSIYLSNGVREDMEGLKGETLALFPQGAGAGGYIACIAEEPGTRIRVKIRRDTAQDGPGTSF